MGESANVNRQLRGVAINVPTRITGNPSCICKCNWGWYDMPKSNAPLATNLGGLAGSDGAVIVTSSPASLK